MLNFLKQQNCFLKKTFEKNLVNFSGCNKSHTRRALRPVLAQSAWRWKPSLPQGPGGNSLQSHKNPGIFCLPTGDWACSFSKAFPFPSQKLEQDLTSNSSEYIFSGHLHIQTDQESPKSLVRLNSLQLFTHLAVTMLSVEW